MRKISATQLEQLSEDQLDKLIDLLIEKYKNNKTDFKYLVSLQEISSEIIRREKEKDQSRRTFYG
jgi:hypothetical protein